ncbi:MAG: trypsin-like peptidase domain-containing protein [Planctomycetaceae bacterium]|nr:trypsin-like peptidase domain-containing protein [Planctomycetaceae bacterium]
MRTLACCLAFTVVVSHAFAQDEQLSPANPMEVPTQLAGLTTKEFTRLVEQAQESVVVVTFEGRDGQRLGLGSGFLIRADGLIATNLHVIGEGRPISVRLRDGSSHPVEQIIATDKTQDLALLKISGETFPHLTIAEGEPLQQGQPVFALGNPRGLEHSVVAGIVSGFRELDDGMSLIQLAIPIERGNSGGPLLDMQGQVHGLLTLKSQQTENLGYAVRAGTLLQMLEAPHPIPMSRWLTIGTLNPRLWEVTSDVHWHQRSGRILVDGQAPGFGGRSLCLSRQDVPQVPYELAVDVLINEDDGAAGLVFHSDGEEKHYGFYPSSGQLRFSRFDGPSVYSWNVLEETRSSALKPNDWNRLKVRVEADRISCYCNDELIFTSADSQYSSGRVGLAKFRHTTAEFKRFRLAKDIPSEKPDPQLLARIEEISNVISSSTPPTIAMIQQNKDFALPEQRALQAQAEELEQRAGQLRQLSQEIHEARTRDQLIESLDQDPPDLLRAALALAAMDNRDLDAEESVSTIQQMAEEFHSADRDDEPLEERLERFHRFFFEEQNYHGNRTNYYDYANSYLNEVIDDREGLPITLSVLYVELANRCGFKAEGVGLPGHFIARIQLSKEEERLVDVFERGEFLSEKECQQRVREFSGRPWSPSYLDAQPAHAIIERMLRNLIRVANDKRDPEAALRYTRTVLALKPDSPDDTLFRAVLCYSTGRKQEGLEACEWLLKAQPPGILLERVRQLHEALTEL